MEEDSFYVISGKLEKPVIFWDAPFRELMDYWEKFEYEIAFENWVQFNNSGKIIPILLFKWSLMGKVVKNNGTWEIIDKAHSNVEDIKNSIELKKSTDEPFIITNLKHLYSESNKFHTDVYNSSMKNKK